MLKTVPLLWQENGTSLIVPDGNVMSSVPLGFTATTFWLIGMGWPPIVHTVPDAESVAPLNKQARQMLDEVVVSVCESVKFNTFCCAHGWWSAVRMEWKRVAKHLIAFNNFRLWWCWWRREWRQLWWQIWKIRVKVMVAVIVKMCGCEGEEVVIILTKCGH